ncbi:MAG: SRPBCC family protein [Pirellulaceae bacterium]|nr:SRPBCC family protein [Pirellulaceae bacterium]
MTTITLTERITAPVEKVFATVGDANEFLKVIPSVVRVEFLTEVRKGVGSKFREVRLMRGKEQAVVLDVTEYCENERIRLVSDCGGTIWDTIFTVREVGKEVELKMVMEVRAYTILAKVINCFILGMLKKAIASDMALIRAYCEEEPAKA